MSVDPVCPWTPEDHLLGGAAAMAVQHDGKSHNIGLDTGCNGGIAEQR